MSNYCRADDVKREKSDIHLSKTLSWLLRHAAVKEGLRLQPDGYITVGEVLNNRHLKNKYSIEDVQRVVSNNDKQRFSLRTDDKGSLQICANQGHTITLVQNPDLLTITGDQFPVVIHGTFYKYWNKIKTEGINRMRRNHVHFAIGLPGDEKVISGVRGNAEVFIYVDVKSAIIDGLIFYKSTNDVILSPGNSLGIIEPKHFLKVINKAGQSLL